MPLFPDHEYIETRVKKWRDLGILTPEVCCRRTDPATSHDAAEHVTRTGRRRSDLEVVLSYVRKYPGRTFREIARDLGWTDPVRVNRRLCDLHRMNLIHRGGARAPWDDPAYRTSHTWYAW